MAPRPMFVAALALGLGFFACDAGPTPDAPRAAHGLSAIVDSFLVDGHATPAAVRATSPPPDEAHPDKGIGLAWTVEPGTLQVFRSTAVHLRVTTPPRDHPSATCSWKFGDGSPITEGCQVSHTFHGGRADQLVTLMLEDGEWQWSSTRTVPLERLTVVELASDDVPATQNLPAKPAPGETSFRFAVIADTAAQGGVPGSVEAGLDALARRVQPDLVIHAGGLVTREATEQDVVAVREHVSAALRSDDRKVAWGLSPVDRDKKVRLDKPNVQMVDDRFFPERYSFTHKGAYFLVVSTGGPGGVDEAVIAWMREELSKAGIYDARYVVSYLPLHKFSDEHVGSLDKRFRLYELFLRARVTTFFSASYRVYFSGHYGALPVVSVGALAGPGGTLAGSDFSQPNSLVVVDQVNGVKERVLALEGPGFDAALDEELLPESVEVYTR